MKIGFIGCGNMASAMIKGMLDSKKITSDRMIASANTDKTREKIRTELGIRAAQTNTEVAEFADVIVLAVKPHFYETVIKEITDIIQENQIIISIAPGKTLVWMEEIFGKKVKLVRTMPNTPALVKEGMTALCCNEMVTAEELQQIQELLETFGKTEMIPEKLMDVVPAVSGSSPAYVFMFIEALADAAVADGMPRAQAYTFAAQAVLGSAKMVLETGLHPGALKDMVCSPGGTTIEAVQVLEEDGMRSAVMRAARACTKKSREM